MIYSSRIDFLQAKPMPLQTMFLCLLYSLVLTVASTSAISADDNLMRPGDRIVLLGNTLIEREQKTGFWETHLLSAFPDLDLTFRNLGWDGDTVWADSRGIFDPPAAGYQRMVELVKELKPTVIVLAYGGVEAFPDETRRDQFEAQYRKLMTDLSVTSARFVHLSPMLMEYDAFPVHSEAAAQHVEAYNHFARKLSNTIENIAGSTGGLFVNLISLQEANQKTQWTTNGLHLTEQAYQLTGFYIAKFLSGGEYSAENNPLALGETAEKIRQLTIEKNRLFFHRWRPQNITYLLGFRKHEQGNNAVEIAEFDPLVAELERKTHELLASE